MFILLISGCTSNSNINEVKSTTTVKDLTTTVEDSTTTLEYTSTTLLSTFCSLGNDTCFFEKAYKSKDRGLCNKITDDNMKFRCIARVEKNPRFCDKIDLFKVKDQCLWDMAYGLNDLSYCKMIFQSNLRENCIYSFVKDKEPNPFECLDLTNVTLRDKCIFYHVGIKTLSDKPYIDPSLCHLIEDIELETKCNNTYLKK